LDHAQGRDETTYVKIGAPRYVHAMSQPNEPEFFMRAALVEAKKGLGQTSPNPAVGAVIALDGKILARGHHRRAGLPHAEIECLAQLGRTWPKNAELYVTLEPCSTEGRTPPCTVAIIAAGVKKVVIGATDPNPRHAGRGVAALRKAGVEVRDGVLKEDCATLNEGFNKWIQTGQPFVIAKCGMSLDGRLTRPPDEGRWLTSPTARRHARTLRAEVDAILIGAETLRHDNPHLTIRGKKKAKQPWRVVLTRSGKLPRNANVFIDRYAERTLVYSNDSLPSVLQQLGRREITSVLIEGGGDVLGQALDATLIDKVQIYLAPLITGGPVLSFSGKGAASREKALHLQRVNYERIGGNILITGYPAIVAE
jgi:diaminohydroxyphosphoribosylaminopyrimidine deaminase / 5-amino-6-(5-phosphoribosylamino)uracil reductase